MKVSELQISNNDDNKIKFQISCMTCKKYNMNVIMTYRNICFGRPSITGTVTVTTAIYVVFLVLH